MSMDSDGNVLVHTGQGWWNGTDHTDTLIGYDPNSNGIRFLIRRQNGTEYTTGTKGYRLNQSISHSK